MGLIKKVKNSSTLTKSIKNILSQSPFVKNKNTINNNSNLYTMPKMASKIIAEMEDPIEIFKKFLFNP
jgi:hypothetical protein